MNWKLGWNFGKRIKELERQIRWCINYIVDLQLEIDTLETRTDNIIKSISDLSAGNCANNDIIANLEKRLAKLENPKKLPVKRKVKNGKR